VLIFDEIDANVSGDESIAIANMLLKLSKNYQIFAISHQPHLASKANQHILITKDKDRSKTLVLDKNGRVEEIARIISGEKKTQEAIDFAMKLLS
jgi:DNA repair protein RecN (Recombination protein N)